MQRKPSQGALDAGSQPSAGVVHRPRGSDQRPLWQAADLAVAASLAALLPPAWLLPDAVWEPLCRRIARVPGLVEQPTLERTIAGIQGALPEPDRRCAAAIALDLQAAVYELRMQNLRAWRPGGWRPDVALAGEEHLVRALAQGKGAILWVAHFAFNSGITKIALHRRGYRVSHLSRPEHGFSKTRFGIACLNPLRRIPEDRHLAERIMYDRRAPALAMRRMVRALASGGIVSITAGAWEGSAVVEGPLFGGILPLAIGVVRLAALTGASLLPVFSVRERDGRFVTTIEPPIGPADSPAAMECCSALASAYLARHEPWVRRFPEQWRGWKEWRRATSRPTAEDPPRASAAEPVP